MKQLTTHQQFAIGAMLTVLILIGTLFYQGSTLSNAMELIKEQERTIELLENQEVKTYTRIDTLWMERIVYSKPKPPQTVTVYDTVFVQEPLFLVSKTFQDELLQGNLTVNYSADVMGYQRKNDENLPTLTNMAINVKYPEVQTSTETTTTQTLTKPQRRRLKPIILPTIGIGYDPIHNTIAPTVGISVGIAKGS